MDNLSKSASVLGKIGGRKSAEKQFKGMDKEERRKYMDKVRKGEKIKEQ